MSKSPYLQGASKVRNMVWAVTLLTCIGLQAHARQCYTIAPFSPTPQDKLPGVDGKVTGMVQWDPDGTGNSTEPPALFIGGDFRSAPSIGAVPSGIVSWNNVQLRAIPAPPNTAGPRIWCAWKQIQASSDPARLVASSFDPLTNVTTMWSADRQFNWTSFGQLTGQVNTVAQWDSDGPSGPEPTFIMVGGTNLSTNGLAPAALLCYTGLSWVHGGTFTFSGSGDQATIYALTPYQPTNASTFGLAVGGDFQRVNGIDANRIAWLNRVSAGPIFGAGTFGNGPPNGAVVTDLLVIDFPSSINRDLWISCPRPNGDHARVYAWDRTGYAVLGFPGNQTFDNFTDKLDLWYPTGRQSGQFKIVTSELDETYTVENFGTGAHPWPLGQDIDPGNSQETTVTEPFDITGGLGTQPEWLVRAINPDSSNPRNPVFNNLARIGGSDQGNVWMPIPNFQLAFPIPNRAFGTASPINGVTTVARLTGSITGGLTGIAVGGDIAYAGSFQANNVALWNGAAWQNLGAGLNGRVNQLKSFRFSPSMAVSDALYAIGIFTSSASTPINRIARLDNDPFVGLTWQPLGTGLTGGTPQAMTLFDFDGAGPQLPRIVVVGTFTNAGGLPVNGVAVWNIQTSAWTTLGTGITGTPLDVAIYDRDGTGPLPARIVVGGQITAASGLPRQAVIEWDGLQWQQFPINSLGLTPKFLVLEPVYTQAGALSKTQLIAVDSSNGAAGVADRVKVWDPSSQVWNSKGAGAQQFPSATIDSFAIANLESPNQLTPSGETDLFMSVGSQLFHKPSFAPFNWRAAGPAQGVLVQLPTIPGQRSSIFMSNAEGTSSLTTTSPYILAAPAPAESACRNQVKNISVTAIGSDLVYRWRRNNIDLLPGPTGTGSVLSGVDTATLSIAFVNSADEGDYSCFVGNGCVSVVSSSGRLTVCDADFNCDAVVDFFDYLDFVAAFASVLPSSDFNNDGVVDFFDYLDFVQAFSEGC